MWLNKNNMITAKAPLDHDYKKELIKMSIIKTALVCDDKECIYNVSAMECSKITVVLIAEINHIERRCTSKRLETEKWNLYKSGRLPPSLSDVTNYKRW